MTLPVTCLLAGVFALLAVRLSLQVSMRRVKPGGESFGDAGDDPLRRRVRPRGDFREYVPTALIVVALVELGGTSRLLVSSLAVAFLVSRALHLVH